MEGMDALLLNTWSFLSFQITQSEVNQIILKNICVDLGKPAILMNWIKCLMKVTWWNWGDTQPKPDMRPKRPEYVAIHKKMCCCFTTLTTRHAHRICVKKNTSPHQIILGRKSVAKKARNEHWHLGRYMFMSGVDNLRPIRQIIQSCEKTVSPTHRVSMDGI